LTRYTDFALRVLMYLGTRPDDVCSIAEIARAYGVSQNHLMKVVHDLGKAGYVTSVRGRFGGIRLARPASEINIGALVRYTEDDFDLVECSTCVIAPVCGLSLSLTDALAAFMAVLDARSLADLLAERQATMARLLGRPLPIRPTAEPQRLPAGATLTTKAQRLKQKARARRK
jgi:Rrf2 family nitric oxide-sensitive transcriptional repressor